MSENKTIGAVVVNDLGQIMPYTIHATMSQCEEHAIERWGGEMWLKLKSMGAKVVQCEISLL